MAEDNIEYLYRMRSWARNVWYCTRREEFTAAELAAGWGDWEFITEQKYNEILGYIAWEQPCHYQAEKLAVTVVGHESFDPVAYVAREKISIERSRKEYQDSLRKKETPAPVQSMAPTSDVSLFDTYTLANLAETVVRVASNAVSGTAETIGDCASAIGNGLSDLCD
jgi:hypothetical protein